MSAADRELTDAELRNLHAYHDGELDWLSRWWWGRRIARSQRLRHELEQLTELGDWIRESESERNPELWDRIAMRLPAIDSARAENSGAEPGLVPESLDQSPGWLENWTGFRPILAAVATAAVAVVVALGTIGDVPGQRPGAVRWLDTGGRSVIVLDNPEAATIVWVLENPVEGV